MTRRIESIGLVVGMLLVALGAATYDWRLGLLVLGALLIVSSVDFREPRR